jgi:hypothetical protein
MAARTSGVFWCRTAASWLVMSRMGLSTAQKQAVNGAMLDLCFRHASNGATFADVDPRG